MRYLISVFLILIWYNPLLSQKNPQIKSYPIQYPYKGKPDKKRFNKKWMTKYPVNFKHKAYFPFASFSSADFISAKFSSPANFYNAKFSSSTDFHKAKFDNSADFMSAEFDSSANFYQARFDNSANFTQAEFNNSTCFNDAKFSSSADFGSTKFGGSAYFYDAKFRSSADFSLAKFSSSADFISAEFDSSANFNKAKFDSLASFNNAKFSSSAYFGSTKFSNLAYFSGSKFNNLASFVSANFNSSVYFNKSKFNSSANFRLATFKEKPKFINATFRGILNFRETEFKKGIDLTEADLDSVHTIDLLDTQYPTGKLKIYWVQFQATDSLRIKVKFNKHDSTTAIEKAGVSDTVQAIQQELYRRTEKIYHKLSENFLAQSNQANANANADDVMYELAWQKQEILNGFWWRIYGWTFGWGYQPLKFLGFIVSPVLLIFTVLWYRKYYRTIYYITYHDKPEFNLNDISQKKWLQKFSHTLFFSGSVLLSIRIKKDWLIKDNIFLSFLYLEWSIGIVLYVLFAIFVQGSRFQFVKGLLGF